MYLDKKPAIPEPTIPATDSGRAFPMTMGVRTTNIIDRRKGKKFFFTLTIIPSPEYIRKNGRKKAVYPKSLYAAEDTKYPITPPRLAVELACEDKFILYFKKEIKR